MLGTTEVLGWFVVKIGMGRMKLVSPVILGAFGMMVIP